MIAKTTKIGSVNNLLSERPAVTVNVPDYVYIAVENARCGKADVSVKEGDHVNLCQVIGVRHAPFFDQPIHSTVSGKVVGVEKHYHRSGKLTNFLKIENDHLDTLDPSVKERTDEEVNALTKDQMVNIIRDCACVGLGGSSFPTYVKLQTNKKIEHILIDAIECEPYLDTDLRFMFDRAEYVIRGTLLLMKMFDCKDGQICIKGIHPVVIRHMEEAIAKFAPNSGIRVTPMKNYYPQGWEVAMIETAMKIKMEPGKIPPDYGVMNCNVTTAASIYLAIKFNRPVTERFMSINGDGIKTPMNMFVRVGTPVKDLIDLCDGYSDPDTNKILILGGPMMGAAVPSEDCIATKTVTSVIVLNEKPKREAPCIRCGSCVLSCPRDLEPVLIMEAVNSGNRDRVKALHPLNCIECGLCTYSCTSGIRVTDFVRRAKILAKL